MGPLWFAPAVAEFVAVALGLMAWFGTGLGGFLGG